MDAALLAALAALVLVAPSSAQVLAGDFDGDGAVDVDDEDLLRPLYDSAAGDAAYDPAADLDGDGRIHVSDLALFGAAFGTTGGALDQTAPSLHVTLNDIPDDMNDLLVVPPELFQITLDLDSAGGSLIDPATLSVTSSQDIGSYAAGTELSPLFGVTPTHAAWEVPAGSDLARTSHYLDVSVADAAGNVAADTYGFAVRDFTFGPPLGQLQRVFLDFDQDRSLGPEIDFLEDLREYGLSSSVDPAIEAQMRDLIVAEIVARVHPYYGRDADGSPGPDAVNIVFSATAPAEPYARLCVGGQSSLGAAFLGASTMDVNNLNEISDECVGSAMFGVFPQAIDNLWGSDDGYQAAFFPLDPDEGGVPVGEDPLDVVVTAPGFDPLNASPPELLRFTEIALAVDAFAQIVATVVAHETGHLLGLVAHGAPPAGLYGGTTGARLDHNVTPGGATPSENLVMNQGGSFSFDEITGAEGESLPVFRPLAWAYLRDRIALNAQVTELLPPPQLFSVEPNLVVFPTGQQTVTVTFHGDSIVATPVIELLMEGDPTPTEVLNVAVLDPQTATGVLNVFAVLPGVYDVRFINPDGQDVTLVDGLVVQ